MSPCGSPLHREQFRTYFYLGAHERSNVAKFNETYSGALGMFLLIFGFDHLIGTAKNPGFQAFAIVGKISQATAFIGGFEGCGGGLRFCCGCCWKVCHCLIKQVCMKKQNRLGTSHPAPSKINKIWCHMFLAKRVQKSDVDENCVSIAVKTSWSMSRGLVWNFASYIGSTPTQ